MRLIDADKILEDVYPVEIMIVDKIRNAPTVDFAIDLDRLKELVEADKEGRCIMLSELKENDNLPETEVIATNNIKYSYGYGSYLIGYIVKDEESKTGHSCENDFSILMNITHWGKLPKITKEKLE